MELLELKMCVKNDTLFYEDLLTNDKPGVSNIIQFLCDTLMTHQFDSYNSGMTHIYQKHHTHYENVNMNYNEHFCICKIFDFLYYSKSNVKILFKKSKLLILGL